MTDPALVVRRADPLNCETPVSALIGGTVMPTAHFYVRNHFAVPVLDGKQWRLGIRGLVRRPLSLSLQDLLRMPAHATTVTLECAGNGRAFLTPTVSGEQWELGAVSTAEWVGVALTDILDLAGVESAAHEVVFTGADGTPGSEGAGPNRFQRSLTIDEVQQSETLLAYSMNGEPLPPNHGYPLRVVVPGWYGVASVKWLTDIEVIGDFFSGYFQTEKYVYEWERDGHLVTEPVRQLRVRALVTQPSTAEVVEKGPLVVRGLAWSGVAPVARVEVSLNHGEWQAARLLGEGSKHAWQRWELSTQIDRPGRATVRARATDLAGRTQPDQPEWNRLGYGNNAVQDISFHVKGRRAR